MPALGKPFDIVKCQFGHRAILERLRSAVFPMQVRGAWGAYAESDETVYPATSAIEKSDDPPAWQPPVSPESGCWWLWLVTGMPVCSWGERLTATSRFNRNVGHERRRLESGAAHARQLVVV